MKKLTILIATVVLSIAITTDIKSQQASDEQVYELLETMDAEAQFISNIEMSLDMKINSGQMAGLPEGFQEEFLKEAKAGFATDLLPKMMMIYQQNFTVEEIVQLTEFYKSDLGQILLKKLPAVQSEAANAGMIWGQQLGIKVMENLSK